MKIQKIKKTREVGNQIQRIKLLRRRNFTLEQKIVILKTIALSKVVFKTFVWAVPLWTTFNLK